MFDFGRLERPSDWIDLGVLERERTPSEIVEVGIQLHAAGVSLANTERFLERLSIESNRTAIHGWVQKTTYSPPATGSPITQLSTRSVIQLNDKRHWLYAVVNPETNEFLHFRQFQTRTMERTMLFLREFREKVPVIQATILVDYATNLKTALVRLGLRFQVRCHGNRNAVERVFREAKRRTSSFSNTFGRVKLPTAESWLQTVAIRWNQC